MTGITCDDPVEVLNEQRRWVGRSFPGQVGLTGIRDGCAQSLEILKTTTALVVRAGLGLGIKSYTLNLCATFSVLVRIQHARRGRWLDLAPVGQRHDTCGQPREGSPFRHVTVMTRDSGPPLTASSNVNTLCHAPARARLVR